MSNTLKLLLLSCGLVIFLGCSSHSHLTPPNDVEPTHFYFVQITDTHFGDADHFARVEKIVGEINQLPLDVKCVVHTGDVTSDNIAQDSLASRGLEILNELKFPIHYVAGNHDISKKDGGESRALFERNFGPFITVNEYQGVQFITIYTEPLAKGYVLEGYDPLAELEVILSNQKPSIIIHHRPSAADFYSNSKKQSWKEDAREKWENLLNTYNVKGVLAGHYHRDEHHWLGTVPLYVSAPVGSWWGRQPTYRIYEYKNGKLGYRTQYIQMSKWKNGSIPTLKWD